MVKSVVAIDGPRVRFTADAKFHFFSCHEKWPEFFNILIFNSCFLQSFNISIANSLFIFHYLTSVHHRTVLEIFYEKERGKACFIPPADSDISKVVRNLGLGHPSLTLVRRFFSIDLAGFIYC